MRFHTRGGVIGKALGQRLMNIERHKRPLLSVVVFGRNDEYHSDFVYRLSTTANHGLQCVDRLGLSGSVEFVIVDWGSKKPLYQALKLSKVAGRHCRIVYVDLMIAQTESVEIPSGFSLPKAQNAGVRRATGDFVMIQGADLIMSISSWASLFAVLTGRVPVDVDLQRALLNVPRRLIPASLIAREPTLDELDRWMQVAPYSLHPAMTPKPHIPGGMGAHILSRSRWHFLRGVEERYGLYGGHDPDLGVRAMMVGPWIDLSNFGVIMHKMAHSYTGDRARQQRRRLVNKPWVSRDPVANSSNWGLGDVALREFPAEPAAPPIGTVGRVDEPNEDILASADEWRRRASCAPTQRLAATIARSAYAGMRPTVGDLECLSIILWHSTERHTPVYVEVGYSKPMFLTCIAANCASAELYVFDPIRNHDPAYRESNLYAAARRLPLLGFRGHFRALFGDQERSAEVLSKDLPSLPRSYLVVFHVEPNAGGTLETYGKLIDKLPAGSIVVVWSESEIHFSEFAEQIEDRFPDRCYRFASEAAGMVVIGGKKVAAEGSKTERLPISIVERRSVGYAFIQAVYAGAFVLSKTSAFVRTALVKLCFLVRS